MNQLSPSCLDGLLQELPTLEEFDEMMLSWETYENNLHSWWSNLKPEEQKNRLLMYRETLIDKASRLSKLIFEIEK